MLDFQDSRYPTTCAERQVGDDNRCKRCRSVEIAASALRGPPRNDGPERIGIRHRMGCAQTLPGGGA